MTERSREELVRAAIRHLNHWKDRGENPADELLITIARELADEELMIMVHYILALKPPLTVLEILDILAVDDVMSS